MSTAATYNLWLKWLVIACWVGMVVLGALVQFGWHAQIDWLPQLRPNQRAMQYNTALCFFVYGLGQLALAARRPRWTLAAAVLVVAIAALTLGEYVFEIDFGIDQIFARDYLTAQTLYPGRMAAVSGGGFVLAGTALLLQSMRPPSVRLAVVVLLNAAVLTIGATLIFGYASQIMLQDLAGSLGRPSFHTATGFVVIGIGSMLGLWIERRAGALARSNRDLQAEVQARSKAEAALRETSAFLDSALDNMPMMFWVKDAKTLRYLQLNRAGEQLVGIAKERIIGKTDAELFPTEAHAYAAKDREALAGREVVEIAQELMRTQDKGMRIMRTKKLPVFDEHGKPQYIIGIAEDITEAARMHQALADSEESHRLIAETSGDMIVRITPAGVLTYVSPASVAVLGYPPEELMQRAVPEFIHPDDREEALRAYGEVVQRNVIRVVTCRLLMRNGRWAWTETSFRAVRDRLADRTSYVIGVCRNIDERVQVADALREANEDLAEYHAIAEEEKRVAKHVLDQLVRVDRTLADRVSSWILPASYFSGDVIAVAETPGRVLHLLLADGTGHGLSAALGALPAVQPFHAMTQRGSSIATIVREMNSKMRALLPTGRFIAATLASIDPRSGVIQVWNGGNPACFLVGDDGEVLRRFTSTHLALGVVGDHEFDAQVETIVFDCNCQLVMVSDGLVDAQNANGEAFGEDRVLRWCADAPPGARLLSLRSAIHGHLEYKPPDDDISIMLVRCRLPTDALKSAPAVPRAAIAGATDVELKAGHRLQLALGVDQLSAVEVVPALYTLFTELRLVSRNDSAVFVVLNELFNNAVDHGLLRLESQDAGRDAERYVAERARRLAELETGSLQIAAERIVVGDRTALRLVIRDTGDGFDSAAFLRPGTGADGARRAGGIAIVQDLCSALEYRDGGREVEAVVPLML